MSVRQKRYVLIALCIAAILILFAACVATGGARSSSGEASALVTPSEQPNPPAETVSYTVTSVKSKRVDGDNCVIARVKVTNHQASTMGRGAHTFFPSPFKLVNGKGKTVRSVMKYLTLSGDIDPGQQGRGSITFCAAGLAGGSKVTLHHGKRKWKVAIPKPKPKRTVRAPRTPPRSSGGGAGYRVIPDRAATHPEGGPGTRADSGPGIEPLGARTRDAFVSTRVAWF
ncbi:DUF4352 domain-containing protein [Actinomadura coerulea]|uniref:DUF4352 domain-containing protein n=1 Tax=Actinomadura coerulea TaxID=46159 RepID=UPI0034404B1A